MAVQTTTAQRQPSKLDYSSQIQFRFEILYLPLVEYFIQSANVPGLQLGTATVPSPLYDYPVPGDTLTFDPLNISFLVDENLNNFNELHKWISRLGFGESHQEFADLLQEGTPSQRTSSSKGIQRPLPEVGTYSDATLTILSSKNIPKTEIRFKNIFPTSISGLDYNIGGTDIDYITCNASFSYLGYTINQISTT
jgi:hypothetical protein